MKTYRYDRAHGANDKRPEDGGLLANGPAEVLGGGLEEFDGSHGGWRMTCYSTELEGQSLHVR